MITSYREFAKRLNQYIRRGIFELEVCINLSGKGHILLEVTTVLNLGLDTDE